MDFFPSFPFSLQPMALFGLAILLGLIGGEFAKRVPFLPCISGYIAIGFLVGPGGLNLVNQTVLVNAHFFVDVSLSLILFNLGRHLDLVWLRHDRGLLAMALAESGLTFLLIFTVLIGLGYLILPAALAATIATATSPAVVMVVAHDIAAEGPVTRRALILTSLNNLFALAFFTLLLPLTQPHSPGFINLIAYSSYRFVGSILLGVLMFYLAVIIAKMLGKQKESQFILLIGLVTLTIELAHVCHVSSMFTLFALGAAARNLDWQHVLMEIDFGWLARIFFILLFVMTGIYLKLDGLWQITGAVILFIVLRVFAKITGVMLFARKSRLTRRQGAALGFTLIPMAGLAIGMSNTLIETNPEFGQQVLLVIAAAGAVFNLVGPIVTQYALTKIGEAAISDAKQGG